jgi:hypothetical protein
MCPANYCNNRKKVEKQESKCSTSSLEEFFFKETGDYFRTNKIRCLIFINLFENLFK